MNILYVIPARGGSKGIPHKNIKPLCGKPLIGYTIDTARQLTSDEHICVSTDDEEILSWVESYGLKVPFKRPDYLATDTAGTYEVLLHAVHYYELQGRYYDVVVLLQPTSPFRKVVQMREAISLYRSDLDMVVGVKEVSANPYYNCFEEDKTGFLHLSKGHGDWVRRQDVPKAWQYNGCIYVINTKSLREMPMSKFCRIKKYPMEEIYSLDIDSMLDWKMAELILQEKIVKLD